MNLEYLKILVDGVLIREIIFRQGLNLVVNERGVGRTGNSIGKTTLARLVDYIFGGSVDSIYIDEEFKKPNLEIEKLLLKSSVIAHLAVKRGDGKITDFARNVCIDKRHREFSVDDRAVEEGEYLKIISSSALGISGLRPSARLVAPKFIRDSSRKMLNTTHFLDKHASAKDYTEVFLYLFGFEDADLLGRKREASNAVAKRKKRCTTLNVMVLEQKPAAEIAKYRAKVKMLEEEFLKFNYSPRYDNPIASLAQIQREENNLAALALDVSARISNIRETVEILEKDGGEEYLVDRVAEIYSYAEISLDKPLRDLRTVLSFHNELVGKKKNYLGADLPLLVARKAELELEIQSRINAKRDVFADMRSEEALEKITLKLRELGDLKLELGRIEGLLEQQEKAARELDGAEKELASLLAEISLKLGRVNIFLRTFNRYFSVLSKIIHRESYKFELNFLEETGLCDLDVRSGSSNPEGGKKKAEVIAFDQAYIFAVNRMGLNRPQFVFHDSIEDIDYRQIQSIFEISRRLPGQQIISMLVDKLEPQDYEKYASSQILVLSEMDKFFKVGVE